MIIKLPEGGNLPVSPWFGRAPAGALVPAAGAVCHGSCSKLAISCESWRRKRLTTGGVVRENKHLAPGLHVLRPERGAGETSRAPLSAALPGSEPSGGQSPPGLAPNLPPPLGGAARCWGARPGPARPGGGGARSP